MLSSAFFIKVPTVTFKLEHMFGHKYKIVSRNDARATIDHVLNTNDSIELLITDYNLPRENGIWLIQQLLDKHIKVAKFLLISGDSAGHSFTLADIALQLSKEQCFEFLPKPFSTRQLISTIQEILDKDDGR